ncbi:MAG: prepilin-type N-terminal cleavage/methylation domain-containing protein [Desulfuromonadaceae bacterium]
MASDNRFYHNKPLASTYGQRTAGGFTLVELLSVIAIIAILAAMSIPAYAAYVTKARIGRTIAEIRMLEKEITVFQTDKGPLPETLGDIGFGALNDPWGTPYQYLRIADSDIAGKGKLRRDRAINPLNTDYDLYSMGPDRKTSTNLNAKDSLDDIVRARDGAFIDLAEKF